MIFICIIMSGVESVLSGGNMAYLCNCRAISSNKLNEFLKEKGTIVRLKDAMDACSNGAQCCRAHAESCAMAVQHVVNKHNETLAETTIEGPKEPVC